MTSYRLLKCEHVECGYIWADAPGMPEYYCPECRRHQYRDGEIFETLKENLRLRISFYGEHNTSDEIKDFIDDCHECIAGLEECRLEYQSDSAYKDGKAQLGRLDLVGQDYFFLMLWKPF